MLRWLRRFAWGGVALLALWIVAWLGLPALIKWQAPPRLSEALGRNVTIGAVGFKPWSLALSIDDLAIGGRAPADAPLLTVKRALVDLSMASLFKRAPVVEALEIDAPQLRLARTAEGHYDVDDLIARFAPKPDAKPSELARFALYNLQVRDARLSFDDRPVSRVHKIEALQLALPFLSNLPAEVEVKVEPHLAFRLNGTPFDSGAQATPFAQTRSGVLKLTMADLDLAPYLPYAPVGLPVRATHGSVSADLALTFAVPPGGAPSVMLRGTAGAKNLTLIDAAGAPLLDWQRMQLVLRDVQPLARRLGFDSLRIDGLQLHAVRDAKGHINLLDLAAPKGDTTVATTSVPAASPASGAAAKSDADGWHVSLGSLELVDTRVLWNDAAVQPAATLQLDGLNVAAKRIEWPITNPIALSVSGALHPQAPNAAASAPALAEFTVAGPVTDREARLKVAFKGLALGAFAPYLAQTLLPSADGQLAVQAELDWAGGVDAPRLKLAIDSATLDALTLREGSGKSAVDAVTLKQLVLADVQVDLLARSAMLGSVKLLQPVATVVREADGRLNLQRWMVANPAKATPSAAPAAAASSPAWRVQLKDLQLDGGRLLLSDAKVGGVKPPLRVEVNALRVALQALEWHGERAMAPGNLQISARIGAPLAPRGKAREQARPFAGAIDYKGRIGIEPLLVSGKLRLERLPVHLFAPYFADQVQLSLLSAEAGYKGDVNVRRLAAGLDLRAAGDVLLGAVHVATLPDASAPASVDNTDELLSWQAFALSGVKFAMKPQGRPQLEIKEATLSDFYSRLVITEQGRFNLQDVTAAPAGAASAPAPEGAASESRPVASAASAPAPAAAPEAAPLPIDIQVGVTKLVNGRVDFSDHFVRPNYSAALTELNGQLGAFSSGSRDPATLELRGRAAGTALLEISGQLNPTAKPLALDIKAKATDLELAPLSPYAGKYAGYAIERGKLSMDVAYKIDADGKLEARNQVILNQLTFGDKIESKDATKLPVLLAVALLKDRNGVIDINLPVSGSVNDPKFSVGGIIVKVIINLLVKALTAPFALLSGGGSDDLSVVEFQSGTALITDGGSSAIDKVAKALTERPALKMTVTGACDPVGERDAFQHAAIETRLLAQARRENLRAGVPAAAAAAASGASAPRALSAEEHTRLLQQLYKDTDIPNKPRNAVGFAKDIPPDQMEALLKTRTPVSDDAMRELALQRGLAVRDALIAKGLPSERLLLAAPKLRVAADDTGAWTPRVQLSLSTR